MGPAYASWRTRSWRPQASLGELCRAMAARGVWGSGGLWGLWGLGRKEDYMYALAKPHGPCRGSSGSDMHKKKKGKEGLNFTRTRGLLPR